MGTLDQIKTDNAKPLLPAEYEFSIRKSSSNPLGSIHFGLPRTIRNGNYNQGIITYILEVPPPSLYVQTHNGLAYSNSGRTSEDFQLVLVKRLGRTLGYLVMHADIYQTNFDSCKFGTNSLSWVERWNAFTRKVPQGAPWTLTRNRLTYSFKLGLFNVEAQPHGWASLSCPLFFSLSISSFLTLRIPSV